MACQGCGRISQNRMCCPTCIEFGRTSFFCGQECFTKNWKSHAQLHELLKKKQALAGLGTDGSADIEAGSQASVGSTARPKTTSPTEDMPSSSTVSSTRRNLAPLPGGSSLVNNFGAEKRTTNGATNSAKKRPEATPIPGVMGDVVGRTWAFVSSAFRAPGSGEGLTTTAAGARQRASPGNNNTVAQSPRGKVAATQGSKGPWWSTLTRRFALNGLLWALALTTIAASGMFYREHLRYADEQRQAVLDVPDIKTGATREVHSAPISDESTQVSAEGTSSVASPLLAGLGLGGASMTAPASNADSASSTNAAATSQVNSLRAEVAALRELVERHDKMLRYVMDRYVEKGILGSGQADTGAKDSAAHEVTPEDVTKSNNAPVPDVSDTVRAGKAHRKGGHSGEALPMGDVSEEMPPSNPVVPEAQEAQKPKENADKPASGDVTKEDPSLTQSQDMEQNQLGI